jgi:hypothetical protein
MAKINITNQTEPADGVGAGTTEIYVDSADKKLKTKDDADVVHTYSDDHVDLSNIGTNTHAQLDTAVTNSVAHIADVANPHAVDIDDVTPTTTKGDLIIENGTNAIRVAVGTDAQVLTADSAEASGVKWADSAGGGSGSTVYGFQNPVDTSWKYMFNDLDAKSIVTGSDYGGGTLALATTFAGTSGTTGPSTTAYADRYGVATMSNGTSASAYNRLTTSGDETYRAGDGRIKYGCAMKFIDLPRSGDLMAVLFGFGDATNFAATNHAYFYANYSVNTTNWLCWSKGSGTAIATDTGVAFDTNWVNLEIDMAADLSDIKYYMDGALVHTETTATAIPVAGTGMSTQVILQNVGARTQVNELEVDWVYTAIKPTNARGAITDFISDTPPPGAENPVDTTWKVRKNDFGQGDGNNFWGELSMVGGASTGASIAEFSVATDSDRHGIVKLSCGSTYATLLGYVSEMRFGQGEQRFGCAINLDHIPDVTDDYYAFWGYGIDANSYGTYHSCILIDRTVSTTNFVARTRRASVDTDVDTGVPFATGQWYNLEIIANADNTLHTFYIDGVSVATSSTNMPNAAMAPQVMISNVAGVSQSFQLDWLLVAHKPSAALGVIHTWITN